MKLHIFGLIISPIVSNKIPAKYMCLQNINEMDLLLRFHNLLLINAQNYTRNFREGGGGGGPDSTDRKTSEVTFLFLSAQLIFTVLQRRSNGLF